MGETRFFLIPLGCQMNKLDAEHLEGALRSKGWIPSDDEASADIVIFLTCSVREKPERKVFSRIRQIRKSNGRPLVCVAGCMAQRMKGEILDREENVDLVLGTGELSRGADMLQELLDAKGERELAVDLGGAAPPRDPTVRSSPHLAFVAAARGCSKGCSYCVVPEARGPLRSRPVTEIVSEARLLLEAGVKEITLIAQSISSYGLDGGAGGGLARLLEEIHDLSGLKRLRFVTSHPADLDRSMLEAVRDLPKVCHHIHMPAQSGSNRILKSMGRGYTREMYLRLVAEARDLVPEMEFTSDFIVGYPGEGEPDFAETVDLVTRVGFQNIFVFQYSGRPGTRAYAMKEDLSGEEKRRRNHALLEVQRMSAEVAQASWIGREVDVLVEGVSKRDATRWAGRTLGNRIVVLPRGEGDLGGVVVRVSIERSTPLTLFGRRVCDGGDP
ncbi:MAG: tRNA (N6-isopentenyl adenosine(37)-C2)-methylthiotransferase MiaB [Planctomycetota bacterium]